MANLFDITEEEKNRIRGLHLTESKDKRITSVLREIASPEYPWDPIRITMNFDAGKDTSDWKTWTIEPAHLKNNKLEWIAGMDALLDWGMLESDRPFIEIKGGTSGTGDSKRNQEVMNNRMDTALEELEKALKIFEIEGKNGLPYSAEGLKRKTTFDRDYDMIEPGSILPTGEQVPTDPNDPFFKDKQYVTITLNPTTDKPEYGSLADKFWSVTMEKTGTNEDAVYSILDDLRDAEDFIEFNDELSRDYGKDFYEVACDFVSVDLNPLWPGETEGPAELGMEDTTINTHLRRLGVKCIDCKESNKRCK